MSVSASSILLFFVYTWGIGYSVSKFAKNSESFVERNVMRVGFGLAGFALIGCLLNLLHIPLDWRIFIFLSIIGPAFFLYKWIKEGKHKSIKFPKLKITKTGICIFVAFLLFAFTLFMYVKGESAYPWLADGDSWDHAGGAKYIAVEKTAFEPEAPKKYGIKDFFQYLDAYPPGYDMLMGTLYHNSEDLMWTLKFFNALIISLGILFFFFFMKKFTGDKYKAVFSTFILAVIPCYLTHFIWAHTYAVTMIFPLFYAVACMETEDKNEARGWMYISIIVLASMPLIQPTKAIKAFVMLALYGAAKWAYGRKFLKRILIIGAAAGLLSVILWWGPVYLHHPEDFLSERLRHRPDFSLKGDYRVGDKGYFGEYGSATRLYTWKDFFIAQPQGMINASVGVGWVICILAILGLVFIFMRYKSVLRKENMHLAVAVLWLIFTFAGLYGCTVSFIPICLFTFRFWILFAIPVSIIAAEGLWLLFFASDKILKKGTAAKIIILLVIVVGAWLTSGYQKYTLNTSMWGGDPGLMKYGQIQSYIWLSSLEKGTKVYYFCPGFEPGDQAIPVYGADNCPWCETELSFRYSSFNDSGFIVTPQQTYSWMAVNGYEYIFIDGNCLETAKTEQNMNGLLNGIANSGMFTIAQQTQGGSWVFRKA